MSLHLYHGESHPPDLADVGKSQQRRCSTRFFKVYRPTDIELSLLGVFKKNVYLSRSPSLPNKVVMGFLYLGRLKQKSIWTTLPG
jgi:hypothetical protein